MVRNYKKKTNRSFLDENIFINAIQQVMHHNMSERVAARVYIVKRTSLDSKIKKLKTKCTLEHLARMFNEESGNDSSGQDLEAGVIYSRKCTATQVFNSNQEKQLVKYIKTCSEMNYGMAYS